MAASSLIDQVDLEAETPNEPTAEPSAVSRQLPWMAIAMVFHGVLLLVAALIASRMMLPVSVPPLEVNAEEQHSAVPPEQPEPEEMRDPDTPVEADEVVQALINEEALDPRTEDASDSPSLLEGAPDQAESPVQKDLPNSAYGMGGSTGGGTPGPGGGGPNSLRGRRTDRTNVSHHDRTNAALQWLADHQSPNGHWSAGNFLNDSIRLQRGAAVTRNIDFRDDIARIRGSADLDGGMESYTVGLSGLALLAFLGDGHTHKDGSFSPSVRRAVRFLMNAQDPEGCFGARDDDEFVYGHAICAMAFAELSELTLDPMIRTRAQKAVDFIIRCQNPGAGWRYGVQPKENDASVTAWMVLALKSAAIAGLAFDADGSYLGANATMSKLTGKDDSGYARTGYDRPGGGNARTAAAANYEMNSAMDACSVMVRLFSGHAPASDRSIRSQAQLMLKDPIGWDGGNAENGPWMIDYYYWYYASLALYQIGGDMWNMWEAKLIRPVLLAHQRGFHRKDLAAFGPRVTSGAWVNGDHSQENPDAGRWLVDEHGSWDPVDPWGMEGGRVYATAINALTLQVYYRYRRVGGH